MLEPGDATEVARFFRYVVKGPGERDCWWWIGSVSNDSYGRKRAELHRKPNWTVLG